MIDGSESPNASLDSGSRDGAVVRALASHQCVPGSIIIIMVIVIIISILILTELWYYIIIQAKCSERVHSGQPESCSG